MTLTTNQIATPRTRETPLKQTIRVLIVDDSALYRKVVTASLKNIPNIEVIGTAPNGQICLQKIEQFKPDLITLDLELPDMNGVEVLQKLKETNTRVLSIIVSSISREGCDITLKALENGALDFVTKPSGGTLAENVASLCNALKDKINAFAHLLERSNTKPVVKQESRTEPKRYVKTSSQVKQKRCDIVTIGISTGGPEALMKVIPMLPKDLPVPVLIVQHMPAGFTQSLANRLDKLSALNVREGIDQQVILPGEVWIAPGGKQMKVVRNADQVTLQITDDPPIHSCKPSVDYLFQSVVETYNGHTLGVIMTGMGHDGTDGCREIKRVGGSVITQTEESCVVFGMPQIPFKEGLSDASVDVMRIAKKISEVTSKER